MNAPWSHSVRARLGAVIMMTSTIALLLACLGFVSLDVIDEHADAKRELSLLSEVIGSNSGAALAFRDSKAAREILGALRTMPSVRVGCIYDKHGVPFATYPPGGPGSVIPKSPGQDGISRHSRNFELFRTIKLDNERIGTLYIESDSSELDAHVKEYLVIVVGITLTSWVIAFVIASRLQGRISAPIVDLARVAKQVSTYKDFGLRAKAGGTMARDEIGDLVIGFNTMLAEIERRDDSMVMSQAHLEEQVGLRTAELSAANSQLVLARDVAEKVAEINAQLSRDNRVILDSAGDGIFGLDGNGITTFINPSAARMLGWSVEEIVGRKFHDVVHASDAAIAEPDSPCPLSGDIPFTSQTDKASMFRTRTGRTFPVEYTASTIRSESDNPSGVVVTFRDVTERRAIERMKDEFVSTVSHELRTPLTSIRGALGLLNSGMLGSVAEKGRRMLEIAVSNTDRLVRLINDILDLERIGSGRIELIRSTVSAHDLMAEAAEGLHTMALQAGVTVDVEPVEAALWIDRDRIMQALTNLLSNAIKFSLSGTTVTLSGGSQDGTFTFRVADQGRGVPEDKLEIIFERFKQVDASDSRDRGGSGLGLAICRSIVNAHGGRIWAEANRERGALFQFTVPLRKSMTRADSSEEGDSGARTMPVCGSPSVLIVEDDLDLARVMATTLEAHGISTVHAADGRQAVELCQQQEPILIVLDLVLPEMDGFAVVDALREHPSLASIPLLVYTALEVGAADQERLKLGPTEFLTKSRGCLQDFESRIARLLELDKEGRHAA